MLETDLLGMEVDNKQEESTSDGSDEESEE